MANALPGHMSYQGQLLKDGAPYTGPALFKFAIVDVGGAGVSLWSNDGSSTGGLEPATGVTILVDSGLFSVRLGDLNEGMLPLDAVLLVGTVDPILRIWVDTGGGTELLGDQPLSSSVFALQADAAERALSNFSVTGNLGVGVVSPAYPLHVSGIGRFDLPSGSISVSTPGGWPGWIMYSQNGNRRDVIVDNAGLRILAGGTSSPPGASSGIRISESGNVGIGVDSPSGRLEVAGMTRTQVLEITGGSDLSERFDIRGDEVLPGMTVCIDPGNPGALVVSTRPEDPCVAGVVSGAGGVNPGVLMGQSGSPADGAHPVALSGRVWTFCDATAAPIAPGDLLVTSAVRGHAMRATGQGASPGTVIGKAMTGLEHGRGLVLVLVSLQ